MEVQGLRWLAPRAAAACLVVSVVAINASASASPSWYQVPPGVSQLGQRYVTATGALSHLPLADWAGEPAETPAYGSTTAGGTSSGGEDPDLHGEVRMHGFFPLAEPRLAPPRWSHHFFSYCCHPHHPTSFGTSPCFRWTPRTTRAWCAQPWV